MIILRGISFRDYNKAFRSAIESDDLNMNFQDIYNDLGEAYRREQYINNRLQEYISDMSYQNQMLDTRVGELNAALAAASGYYTTAGGNVMYWSAYNSTGVVSNTSRQDLGTGQVTLPWSRSYTKIPLTMNEYNEYEADNIVRINYCNDYYNKPDDLYDAVDNNPETAWVKSYPIATAPTSITMRVELPASSNPAMNSIYVSPFPDGGPSITNLRYLSTAGSWVQVPNFSTTDIRKRYHFSPVDYGNQVDLTMTGVGLKDEGSTVKVFGLQDIDISLIEYSDSSDIVVKLDAAAGTSISNITYLNVSYTISPTITNETNISSGDRPVVIEVYEDSGLTTRVYSNLIYTHSYTGSIALSSPSTSIWTKISLKKINSTTPVVTAITIKYN